MHDAVQLSAEDRRFLAGLDARLKTLLPPEYGDTYEQLQPRRMRSAGLKYDAEGRVAWDQMWGSFCDLAMAGGPPHKGSLLEPGNEPDIDRQFGRYDAVVDEICRGIGMATGLRAYAATTVGWVCATCPDEAMANWLFRAIAMENVAVRRRGAVLELPAAPHFRLEKEIKNVVTVIAKTCHYWVGHIPVDQRHDIAELLAGMAEEWPLVEPDSWQRQTRASDRDPASALAASIRCQTGLHPSTQPYAGWLGVDCGNAAVAVWMMRALVASNVLARREETTLFVPVNAVTDPHGALVASAVGRVYRCASGLTGHR